MLFSPDSIGELVLNNNFHASALIGCILLIRTVAGRRLPAQCFHLLWILAAIRLVTPVLPESPWSVFPLFSYPAPAHSAPPPEWNVRTEPARTEAQAAPLLPAVASAPTHSAATMRSRDWLTLLWLAGVGAQILLLAGSAWRMRCAIAKAVELRDPYFAGLARACARQMRLRSVPRIFETSAVSGPAVVGLWRPRLLLPEGLKDRLSEKEFRFVLLHECAHLRRRDLPALWFLTAVRVLHWFNPLVWLAVRMARVDVELACDETVLRRTNTPIAYGETLLKLAQTAAGRGLAIPAIGIVQNKHSIRTRLTRIGLYSPRTFLRSWLPSLLLLAAAGLCFGAGRKTAPGNEQPAVKTSQPVIAVDSTPAWARGWSVEAIAIPNKGKLSDAHVTFKSPAGRAVTLSRGISSKEGVSLASVEWVGTPVQAKVVLRNGDETAAFKVDAASVSNSESLKRRATQIEISSQFIELPEAIAKNLPLLNVAPNTIRIDPGTPAPLSANVLYQDSMDQESIRKLGPPPLNGPRTLAQLEQIIGVDIMSAPRVTTKSGQRAVVEIIRELRYPTVCEKGPEGWVPLAFETRNTGSTLEVEPVIEEDGLIRLKVVPQCVELQGWIDHETRHVIAEMKQDETKPLNERLNRPISYETKPDQWAEPVFSTRKASLSVSLRSGQSVLLVGLPETEKIAPLTPTARGRSLVVLVTARLIDETGKPQR